MLKWLESYTFPSKLECQGKFGTGGKKIKGEVECKAQPKLAPKS